MKSPLASFALGALILVVSFIASEAEPRIQSMPVVAASSSVAAVAAAHTAASSTPSPAQQKTGVSAAAVKSASVTAPLPTAEKAITAVAAVPDHSTPNPVANVAVSSTPSSGAAFSALESAVIADINAARAQSGLSPLTSDTALGTIARAHSADMLANNYFDHTSPDGCTAVCRYQNAGYPYWSMGENIYWMEGFTLATAAAAQQIVDSWQNSAGHRANDLGDYTRIGVGISQSGTKYEVTTDFATPR